MRMVWLRNRIRIHKTNLRKRKEGEFGSRVGVDGLGTSSRSRLLLVN